MTNLENLGLAYRKAKVDLYYSSHASLDAIADYEEALHQNLAALQVKINAEDESWFTSSEFIGTWMLATKSVEMQKYRERDGNSFIHSYPAEEWAHACGLLANGEIPVKPVAEFRLMARCGMDFHVLSTLWMLEVGHLFDARLTGCAYGNRLRRKHNGKGINPLSLGSFTPYLKPFRDWRDKGISSMSAALDEGKEIIALTADVSSFYHELNPGFMLNADFIKNVLGLELNEEQAKLHRLFIHALQAWAAATPLKKGLPVGLPASAVVANVALVELDSIIERQIVPLYYGRYVDDIMLVIENGVGFRSTAELWEWLFARSDGKLDWVDGNQKMGVRFQPEYLKAGKSKSQIDFANAKNKVFMLAGEPGKTLVDAIAHQIYERASEWRAMPRLPRSASHVSTDLLIATQSDGETADNLRKADALTMRRAGFAIKLRDFEAYERDLHPDAWKEHRRAFFRSFIQHVLVLPQFFDLAGYLPRVTRMATACEDYSDLRKIIAAVERLCQQVSEHCDVKIKACSFDDEPTKDQMIARWQGALFSSIRESVTASSPPRLTKAGKQAWDAHMADYQPTFGVEALLSWPTSTKSLQSQQSRLFSFDLAHMPFRFLGLSNEIISQRGIPAKKTVINCTQAAELLPDTVLDGSKQLAKWIKVKGLPHGLLFATRPFNLAELSILNKDLYLKQGQAAMRDVVLALRGFSITDKAPCFDKHGVLQIPDGTVPRRYGIAFSSWQTQIESWTAAVKHMPDPNADRYARLCQLLDSVIAQPRQSRYLILPELALPARWFMRIAHKLQGRGISLITGVEYLHAGKSRVRNQVWAALAHDGLGFPSIMIYRQDKQRPALHEELELRRLAGLEMKPETLWKNGTPPIIQPTFPTVF